MNLPVQHLSDEAIAAFADGVLAANARARAVRHLNSCAECSQAVAIQREAAWALRTMPTPALPSGLLDRLRSLPQTTPLSSPPSGLGPGGVAVFPAYGTDPSRLLAEDHQPPVREAEHSSRGRSHPHRDGLHFASHRRQAAVGLLGVAAAVLTVGAVGGGTATASGGREAPGAPVPARMVPADVDQLVTPATPQRSGVGEVGSSLAAMPR